MKMPRHVSVIVLAIAAAVMIVTGSTRQVARAVAPAPGTIDTFAGGGSLTGDGIPATGALLAPYGIAVDSAGNVFFSDLFHCSVRKVSHGLISTAVGTGICAGYPNTYSGDGGPATEAMLNRPAGLAFDSSGNLYIADGFNCSIRKVEARSGTITTVAGRGPAGCGGSGDGGPATQASLWIPVGIAIDGPGNLYIADSGNCRVRKVTNGVISTVAGAGVGCVFAGDGGPAISSGLSSPQGIAVDGAGNLYIADGCRIREVSSGVINTVAGSGTCYFNGDGPATTALLNGPELLSLDGAGNLFIADSGNCLVRRLSGGILTTVAGLGVTLDNLHFAVCGFSGDGGPATAAELGFTAGVAVDGGGNLYISDLGDMNNPDHARVRIVYGSTPPDSGTANDAPVLSVPGAQSVQYSHPLSFGISASDPDGDTLVLSAAGLPAGLAFTDNGDGTARVSGTVLAPAGTYTATLWVSDGSIPPVAGAVSIIVSSTPYAVFSYSNNCSGTTKDIDWSGGGVHVTGDVHTNGKYSISGTGNTFTGPVTFGNGAGCASSGGNNTYTNGPPAATSSIAWPAYAWSFFTQWANFWNNPAGAGCTKTFSGGNWNISDLGSATHGDGVYCSTNGDLNISHCNAAAHVTLVAKGKVSVSGCAFPVTAYGSDPNGLLAYTDCSTCNPAINVSMGGGTWSGLILAHNGESDVTGSNNVGVGLNGGVYGQTVKVSGSNWSLTGAVPASR